MKFIEMTDTPEDRHANGSTKQPGRLYFLNFICTSVGAKTLKESQ